LNAQKFRRQDIYTEKVARVKKMKDGYVNADPLNPDEKERYKEMKKEE